MSTNQLEPDLEPAHPGARPAGDPSPPHGRPMGPDLISGFYASDFAVLNRVVQQAIVELEQWVQGTDTSERLKEAWERFAAPRLWYPTQR